MEREPFGLLVPAYVDPGVVHWDVLLAVGRKLQKGLITVANPSSGPGDPPPNQDYVKAIRALHNRCASVIGYVHDSYGTNPNVFDDMDEWFSLYDVDGIFIDQASHTDQQRTATLLDHVRGDHADRIIVLNPGTIPSQEFVEAADPALVVIQEQAAAVYEGNWPPAGWVRDRADSNDSISADRLAVIAHTAPSASDVEALIEVAATYRLGWVFVQNTPGPIYNKFSTWLPTLGNRLQCARATSPSRYFTCKALGGIPCMASQALARLTRR
jgi:hypothetical protein